MIALTSIIERIGADYLAKYGDSTLPSQRQTLNARKNCRFSLGPGMQRTLINERALHHDKASPAPTN